MFPGSSAVEQSTVNRLVASSNLARGAIHHLCHSFCRYSAYVSCKPNLHRHLYDPAAETTHHQNSRPRNPDTRIAYRADNSRCFVCVFRASRFSADSRVLDGAGGASYFVARFGHGTPLAQAFFSVVGQKKGAKICELSVLRQSRKGLT